MCSRVQTQKLAGATHFITHGNRVFVQDDPGKAGIAGKFVERCRLLPPRVGSRIQRTPEPAAATRASTIGKTERVSELRSAARSNSPRASRMVIP